jgi:hypothetical protein
MTQEEMITPDLTDESGKQRIWRFPNEPLWKRIVLLPLAYSEHSLQMEAAPTSKRLLASDSLPFMKHMLLTRFSLHIERAVDNTFFRFNHGTPLPDYHLAMRHLTDVALKRAREKETTLQEEWDILFEEVSLSKDPISTALAL